MSIIRILIIATGLEMVGLALVVAVGGLLGVGDDLLDMANTFAPVWCAMALAGGALAWVGLGRRPARVVSAVAALVAGLITATPVAAEYLAAWRQAADRPREVAHPFKVMTLNASAESFSAERNTEAIIGADPDVVLVQEPVQLLMDRAQLDKAYPYRLACTPMDSCGLVIWSKRPFLETQLIARAPGQPGWDDLDFISARLIAPDGLPATVATAHFRWQIESAQPEQRQLFTEYAAKLRSDELVVGGDLNLTPWTFALRRIDDKMKPVTRRTRALGTWPAYVPRIFFSLQTPILPIDHLYAGPGWKTVKVERIGQTASDHYGVLLTLARDPARIRQGGAMPRAPGDAPAKPRVGVPPS